MTGREVASAVVQASPPVYTSGSLILGHPVNDWVMYGTALYLACQFIVIAPKVYRTLTGKEKK
ncbi:hypothetical protein [Paraburkholderia youngii]|uniref:Uncharacterized protein n=1 Tax=Paraburkholderia youngii TaxID=2782701 RepID=A0A7Y6MY02_9BURK|nr:hypothetical protein [Paraburkholderia youngii]NUX98788.1 hypothetical protein [Paraburkholderia youngii]